MTASLGMQGRTTRIRGNSTGVEPGWREAGREASRSLPAPSLDARCGGRGDLFPSFPHAPGPWTPLPLSSPSAHWGERGREQGLHTQLH